jgi:anti-sigma factor RsiW
MTPFDRPGVGGDARTLEELADAYLDGDLLREEAMAFERDLAVRPETAAALSSALALRELLAGLPPLAPPKGLTDRIAGALPLRREKAKRAAGAPGSDDGHSAIGAALAGVSWVFRLPAMAAMGAAATATSTGSGISQVRWALGPLGAPQAPEPRPKRPLWRRVLFGSNRRAVTSGKAKP